MRRLAGVRNDENYGHFIDVTGPVSGHFIQSVKNNTNLNQNLKKNTNISVTICITIN